MAIRSSWRATPTIRRWTSRRDESSRSKVGLEQSEWSIAGSGGQVRFGKTKVQHAGHTVH